MRRCVASIFVSALLLAGCAAPPRNRTSKTESLEAIGLSAAKKVNVVHALCTAPRGWEPEPIKQSGQHDHQVWLSPSGKTAYGVIRFSLPIPVGPDLVLPFFLQQMRQSEGSATLVEKHHDDAVGGLRFIAIGGLYKVRSILLTRGWQGWAIYAGTVRNEAEDPRELELAERAREHTRVGVE